MFIVFSTKFSFSRQQRSQRVGHWGTLLGNDNHYVNLQVDYLPTYILQSALTRGPLNLMSSRIYGIHRMHIKTQSMGYCILRGQ